MVFLSKQTYGKNEATTWPIPNYWDIVALALIFTLIVLVAWGAKQMAVSYRLGDVIHISLNPMQLPIYALRTTIRLFIALFFSLIFTFIFGTWAAKNKHAERLIIPIIDILQSVPVLSFLSITITGFIYIFKNSMLGPECAAIFGIFTSQVWNMALSFYQSVKTVPNELKEAADIFHLSGWQRFWRIEVPYSMPGLLWNMMMSMSGSWFFVIACEAFSVANHNITLPGIGSYISLAIARANNQAVIYAIIFMFIVIFLYDRLLFRPLIYWTEKFKESQDDEEKAPRVWLISLFQHTKFLRHTLLWLNKISDVWINLYPLKTRIKFPTKKRSSKTTIKIYYFFLTLILIGAVTVIWRFIFVNVALVEVKQVIILGIFTGIRVMSLIFLVSLIWVPIGVWIGLRPSFAATIQPIIQFIAAFPANLLFPIVTILVVTLKLNVEIWVAPLMILGTQWYILFNVIAGTSALPKELKLAAVNFKLKGLVWWRRFILPGIAPYLITGAITAAGGAWNASIVAEIINWGAIKLSATGIGAYIQTHFTEGDFPRIALGTIIICSIVLLINRLFWRPLYNMAIERFECD
ncbi:MAG: ABC transporter permease subunit [Coxiellaceae bacterium]|jgi:NitT/TauT family transport system permease protein|nr:ABC transporter permease subunit [Coxiellaceae bacterium]